MDSQPPEDSDALHDCALDLESADLGQAVQPDATSLSNARSNWEESWGYTYPPVPRHHEAAAYDEDATKRLPAEIWIAIFDLCGPEEDEVGLTDTVTTAEYEEDRLAKMYLLQLSKVCSRWHGLSIGTPMLWSTILADTTTWDASGKSPDTLVSLVAASLARSAAHTLRLHIAIDWRPFYSSLLLETLAQHAPRWRHAHFWNALPSLALLSGAKGKLLQLESLEISNQNDDWTDHGTFQDAPKLTTFTFTGWAGKVPTVPWAQITHFRYTNVEPNDLENTTRLLKRLAPHANCVLEIATLDTTAPPELPAVAAAVSALSIILTANFTEGFTVVDVLGGLLACLTLPGLQTLELVGAAEEPAVGWNQPCFHAFAARSALHRSLTMLELRALITEDELCVVLGALPLLEQLFVSDCEDEKHAVVTDAVLQALVWRETGCLVPKLNFLCLTALLRFADDVCWEMLLSRLPHGRCGELAFEFKIFWLPSATREPSEEFCENAEKLEERNELRFTAAPDPDYEDKD